MKRLLAELRRNTEGVTALEYSLIALLIAVTIIAGVQAYIASVNKTYNVITNSINTSTGS